MRVFVFVVVSCVSGAVYRSLVDQSIISDGGGRDGGSSSSSTRYKQLVLFGHSLGGLLAYELARSHKEAQASSLNLC